MGGHKLGKNHCGVRLPQKECPECRAVSREAEGPECLKCGATVTFFCVRRVKGAHKRCDFPTHMESTDVHPDAAVTPSDYAARFLLKDSPNAVAVMDQARTMSPAERVEQLAVLYYGMALGGDSASPDIMDRAARAQELVEKTLEHAARREALGKDNGAQVGGMPVSITYVLEADELPTTTVSTTLAVAAAADDLVEDEGGSDD